jgi:hypothetical protein
VARNEDGRAARYFTLPAVVSLDDGFVIGTFKLTGARSTSATRPAT